jgi:hypothetical protein
MSVSATPSAAQDSDGDTIPDASDNCLDAPNVSQVDTPDFFIERNDGFGNACDADWNDNGFVNSLELQMLKQHYLHGNQDEYDEEISVDGSGVVNALTLGLLRQQYFKLPGPSGLGTDADADGWVEPGFDNCPEDQNPDQADADEDGIGDLCDGVEPDDFEPVASGAGLIDKLLVDPSGKVHALYNNDPDILWLREEPSGWATTTVYTRPPNAGSIGSLATAMKSSGELCAFWREGLSRNLYGCIEDGVVQPQLLSFPTDLLGPSALAHDTGGQPHVVAYFHGLYSGLNHYLRHTRYNGTEWTEAVNLPVLPGAGDPETSMFDFDIVVDGVNGAVHVVHFFYDSGPLGFYCDVRGDLAVSTWDPTTGNFGPLHIAVQGVDPGLLGKSIWDLSVRLDSNGEIHAVYRVDGNNSCQEGPNYDHVERVFYATGPVLGTWQVTELEERPNTDTLKISNLVRDGSGTLHVASHASSDDPNNIHLFSISGPGLFLRAAPRAGAQQPMLLTNHASTWLVREPPAP